MYGPKIWHNVPLVSVEKVDTQPGRPDHSLAQHQDRASLHCKFPEVPASLHQLFRWLKWISALAPFHPSLDLLNNSKVKTIVMTITIVKVQYPWQADYIPPWIFPQEALNPTIRIFWWEHTGYLPQEGLCSSLSYPVQPQPSLHSHHSHCLLLLGPFSTFPPVTLSASPAMCLQPDQESHHGNLVLLQ